MLPVFRPVQVWAQCSARVTEDEQGDRAGPLQEARPLQGARAAHSPARATPRLRFGNPDRLGHVPLSKDIESRGIYLGFLPPQKVSSPSPDISP